jgi:hypothetical protein
MSDVPRNDDENPMAPDDQPARDDEAALDDLRHEFGDRWIIARITGGYRATPRASGGHTAIPRYGGSPAELAAGIRAVERG